MLFTGSRPLSTWGGMCPLPVLLVVGVASLPRMIVGGWSAVVVEVLLTLFEFVAEDDKLVELAPLVWFVTIGCCGRDVSGSAGACCT